MDNQNLLWDIEVESICTTLRVGIWPHEVNPQPIKVDLVLRGRTPANPMSIKDCIDYQPICEWITNIWSATPHIPLLETRMVELIRFIFSSDARIEWVNVRVAKEHAISHAKSTGIRVALSRYEYQAIFSETPPEVVSTEAKQPRSHTSSQQTIASLLRSYSLPK